MILLSQIPPYSVLKSHPKILWDLEGEKKDTHDSFISFPNFWLHVYLHHVNCVIRSFCSSLSSCWDTSGPVLDTGDTKMNLDSSKVVGQHQRQTMWVFVVVACLFV